MRTFVIVCDCLSYSASLKMGALYDKAESYGTVYTRAYSVAGGTIPSAPSIWTGLYPSQHGYLSVCHGLKPYIPNLQSRFSHRPVGGISMNGIMTKKQGVGTNRWIERPVDYSTDYALDDLDSLVREMPENSIFYVHLMTTHCPYECLPSIKQEARERCGNILVRKGALALLRGGFTKEERTLMATHAHTMYDDSVYQLDLMLHQLMTQYDQSEFIITADHGETFGSAPKGKPAWGHNSNWFWRQLTHVPLFYIRPGLVPEKITYPVENKDLWKLIKADELYLYPTAYPVFEDYNIGNTLGILWNGVLAETSRAYNPAVVRAYHYETNRDAEQWPRAPEIQSVFLNKFRGGPRKDGDEMKEVEDRLRALGYID